MCGIIGAVTNRQVGPVLMAGLARLEYRGYDSAGVAIFSPEDQHIHRHRCTGKVAELQALLQAEPLAGTTGIAHTRWATHGKPSIPNAHPQMSSGTVAVVHNGIIENHTELRANCLARGYEFTSDTDSEVLAHLLHWHAQQADDLMAALQATLAELTGAYALALLHKAFPNRILAARAGSPLVVGLGIEELFVASDQLALLPFAQQCLFLKDGDIADLSEAGLQIYAATGEAVSRDHHEITLQVEHNSRGEYRHFMLKEIFEQPQATAKTLQDQCTASQLTPDGLGADVADLLNNVQHVQIVACGTSYHAGLVARNWIERIVRIPCQVEVASEFRYRPHVVPPGCLFVTISQSGETADTLAALAQAKTEPYLATLAICNVAQSALARQADLTCLTQAGTEVGVASTKAFTTQLIALFLLTLRLAEARGHQEILPNFLPPLQTVPADIERVLTLDPTIKTLSARFSDTQHALFLGRGLQYPIAKEGALKLKEVSYIHAEAYPAGELKHGPLALVDEHMPVIAVMPNNVLLEKLRANLNEVLARGGQLIIFADEQTNLDPSPGVTVQTLPHVINELSPIVYTIPLQLLAYHVAILKGTDVDQPRNLAKSVTVE